MTTLPEVTAVDPAESICRFVTVSRWIRPDNTIRQDAFIPPKDLNLSVTRHLNLSEEQLWVLGKTIVTQVTGDASATLPGRADLVVADVRAVKLNVEAAPLTKNPNHAHITGWPEKAAQKSLAQQLAARARFVSTP